MAEYFSIDVEYPPGSEDIRNRAQSFRDSVGRAVRRQMEDIAGRAEASTHPYYPDIAESYRVTSKTTGEGLEYTIENTHRNWLWTEIDTEPHWPPWKKGTRLNIWAHAVGIPSYIAAAIQQRGTYGHYWMQEAWDDGIDHMDEIIADAVDRWFDNKNGCWIVLGNIYD